ncbi:unnamed protein product [Didymodactylos carnosus]|uniref:Uncharacterized protein n=1 Tax=Didymodactylos carnosus TaxID=1234261 RepID=A0A8S2FK54_9BILA|nr:unnamed protein product [Didymodactylos carnosus]CAF4279990.1 unnamed protein product [Didymodactylos carnosus]
MSASEHGPHNQNQLQYDDLPSGCHKMSSVGDQQPISEKIRELTDNFNDREWSLSVQQLSDADVKLLANALKTNTHCKVLDLHQNKLTSVEAQFIADMLKVNTTLTSLWLSCNRLGDDGTRTLCEVLRRQNNMLEHLSLNGNRITDKSVDAIVDMAKVNQGLKRIYLHSNQISEENQRRISDAAKGRNIEVIF